MGYSNHKHKGVDLIPPSTSETPLVLAYDDGVVTSVGNVSGTNSSTNTAGCGTYVSIKHKGGVVTRYQHLKYNSLKVKKGQNVKKGQPIAYYGRPTTGNSTGSHLHFDISFASKPNEKYLTGSWMGENRFYVNPKPYLFGEREVDSPSTSQYKVRANLNIRSGPGTKYSKVGEFKAGETVTVYANKNGWAKVSKDEEKWVAGNYLKLL